MGLLAAILWGALLWCVLESRYCWSSAGLAGNAYPVWSSISFLTPLSSDVAIATIIGERSPNHERQRAWCVLCARACPTRAASPCPKVRDAVPADHSSIACHCMFVFEFHKRVPNAKRLRW